MTTENASSDPRPTWDRQAFEDFIGKNFVFVARNRWLVPTMVMLLRESLTKLKDYLDTGSNPGITWEAPMVAVRWPVEWDWEKWNAGEVWAGPDRMKILNMDRNAPDLGKRLVDAVGTLALRSVTSWVPIEGADERGGEQSYAFEDDSVRAELAREGEGGGDLAYVFEDGSLRVIESKAVERMFDALGPEEREAKFRELRRPFEFNLKRLAETDPDLVPRLFESSFSRWKEWAQKQLANRRRVFEERHNVEIEAVPREKWDSVKNAVAFEDLPQSAKNALQEISTYIKDHSFYSSFEDRANVENFLSDFLNDPVMHIIEEDGKRKRISARLTVNNYIVNVDEKEVYFTAIVGLFDAETEKTADLRNLTDEEKDILWDAMFEELELFERSALDAAILRDVELLRREKPPETIGTLNVTLGEVTLYATGTCTPPPENVGPVVKLKAGPVQRYLFDAPSRMDRDTFHFMTALKPIKLPRKWSAVRKWDDMVAEEITRIQEEYGPGAFASTDTREALLKETTRVFKVNKVRQQETVVVLTSEAEDALLERNVGRPYRQVLKDHDGATREFLVHRVKVSGGGVIEARLSWYGSAWRLAESERDAFYKQVKEDQGKTPLFEDLDPDLQDKLDGLLRQAQAVKDGPRVIEYILAVVGRDGRSYIEIPAWEFKSLLKCENDSHGLSRVHGVLRALQELRYSMTSKGTGSSFRSYGPFLGDVTYDPRGVGRHGDGVFHLSVSHGFIGSLKVFEVNHKIRNTKNVLDLDFSKNLTKEEVKGLDYVRGFTLGAFYDAAKGFTDEQARLRRWVEDQLTRNRDAATPDRKHVQFKKGDEANEPRVYDSSFCPVLPEGRRFYGALGHFNAKRPENGRTLFGSGWNGSHKSGRRPEGLLAMMGYELPRRGPRWDAAIKKALQDLRAVVEEAMGGIVAVRHENRWYSLEEAVWEIHQADLGSKAKFYLFPAEDYRDRLARDLEAHHQDRHERGETSIVPKVTRDRAVYTKAIEELKAGTRFEPGGEGPPLFHRLLIARRDRKLSQGAVGKLFGVSKMMVSLWEAGPRIDEETGRAKGKTIPPELVPLVARWVESGEAPTAEELANRETRQAGVKKAQKPPPEPAE